MDKGTVLRWLISFAMCVSLFIIPVSGQRVENHFVKPITGTWINLAYQDVRNK